MAKKTTQSKRQWVRELFLIIAIIILVIVIFFLTHPYCCLTTQKEPTAALEPSDHLKTVKSGPALQSTAPSRTTRDAQNPSLSAVTKVPAEMVAVVDELLVEQGDHLLVSIDKHASEKKSVEIETVHHEMGAKIPPHLPIGGVTGHIDFLYWKADEDGLEYGTKMVANPIIGQASDMNTRLLDLEFEWNPGFRLGIGYLFDKEDYLSVDLNWTHIRNEAHGTSNAKGIESQAGSVDTIVSPWVNLLFELRSGASRAHAHWHVKLNTLDLDFSRSFFLSKRFVLDPFFGLRGAWVDQEYRVTYNSHFLLMESSPSFSRDVKFNASNDYRGFGLRGGTEFIWHFNNCWHLFSKLSGNILYGKFKVRMKNLHDQGLGEGEINPMPIDFASSESFWRVRLNFEESIGLGWETFFHKDQYHFSIRAAYELSQWLDQNELYYTFYLRGSDTISSFPIRNQGDLSFHGIQVSINLDF